MLKNITGDIMTGDILNKN